MCLSASGSQCTLPLVHAHPPAAQRCRELSGRSSELLLAAAAEGGLHVSADQATDMVGAVDEALARFGGEQPACSCSAAGTPIQP